jgi:hypothetical protein
MMKTKERQMPRGIPNAGFRQTKNAVARQNGQAILDKIAPVAAVSTETDAEIDARLRDRFEILDELTRAALTGNARSVIVSGPAGLGKSFTVEQALGEWDPDQVNHTIVKGYVKTTGLLRLLYQFREAGQVVVFDDADTVFYEDTSLNLLKAVCDTTELRRVSYMAESNMVDEESGERIPRSCQFDGTILFITNLDMDVMIDKGHKLAPHLQALVSRSHYIDLSMKTRRDYIIRIKQVIAAGMLRQQGLDADQEAQVLDYIMTNQDRLREVSLRIAVKIGNLVRMGGNWQRLANVTCLRNT